MSESSSRNLMKIIGKLMQINKIMATPSVPLTINENIANPFRRCLHRSRCIPSQNPIENVSYKAPVLESKQRFPEDSEWSILGAPKMP